MELQCREESERAYAVAREEMTGLLLRGGWKYLMRIKGE
jgi:hypothetical protein